MQKASVPPKFTYEFLKHLGFSSSNDRPVIPVLKVIGFLDDSSVPTPRYRDFKDKSIAKRVLAEGIREGYADVFAVDTEAHNKTSQEVANIFSRLSDKGESVVSKMATTFSTLCSLADFDMEEIPEEEPQQATVAPEDPVQPELGAGPTHSESGVLTLRHDIHIHLPLSTDVAVYEAIFKSIRANLT